MVIPHNLLLWIYEFWSITKGLLEKNRSFSQVIPKTMFIHKREWEEKKNILGKYLERLNLLFRKEIIGRKKSQ